MILSIPYGKTSVSFRIPDKNYAGMFDPPFTAPIENLEEAVEKALDNPIGSPRLESLVVPGKKVAVIIDDMSRPTPQNRILPVVLRRLEKAGVKREEMLVSIALGSHRKMSEEEIREHVGVEVYGKYRVENSSFRDARDLVHVGNTDDGVRIMASRSVMEADIHIGIGCILPHPLLGWSGGAKILLPGITGEETSAYFHLKSSLSDRNYCGCMISPIRDMIEDLTEKIGLTFIVNVLLNSHLEVSDMVAGDFRMAHREGVHRAMRSSGFAVEEKSDVIICSSHPADQDFWQAQKAMYAAEHGLKGDKGGTIVMVGPNYEGLGPHEEMPFYVGSNSSNDLALKALAGIVPGDHLAIAVGNSLSKLRRRRNLVVVSDGLRPQEMRTCGIKHYPVSQLQDCITDLIAENPSCRIGVLSNGAGTYLY